MERANEISRADTSDMTWMTPYDLDTPEDGQAARRAAGLDE
jgi:hypothetical protein